MSYWVVDSELGIGEAGHEGVADDELFLGSAGLGKNYWSAATGESELRERQCLSASRMHDVEMMEVLH